MKALLLRVSIYLVLVPLAIIVIVPNGFDTLALVAKGEITFGDIAPGIVRVYENLTKKREVAAPAKPADLPMTDLGNGSYKLSDSEWGGKPKGTQMEWKLRAQAERFCAARQGKLHVTNSSNYNSQGYSDADLEFWCEGTVAADQAGELARLDAELIATRDRVAEIIATLDEPQRKSNRDKLNALGRQNMDMLKLSGEAKMQRMREMIALHQALLGEVFELKSDLSEPARD